ncbi:hypothetical protein KP001_00270 [Geomonas subterranea]|uniref:Response regulatory domain-containing protein n=1 Tax=Geomonas subterranea TaxID=2847989 RepID=A0ABX8LK64_9BACT|nr:hypothetical protein [Geomonas subterranea]QXE91019.1 hypothetical protein KP001_00270 [Geomonas subterranea]QXM10896.1 hypothetical protein KP002_07210 [Geomonas subterranea]
MSPKPLPPIILRVPTWGAPCSYSSKGSEASPVGQTISNEIRKLRGDVKALFVSGYTNDIINKAGLENQGLHLMPKPIQPAALLRRIRELLD